MDWGLPAFLIPPGRASDLVGDALSICLSLPSGGTTFIRPTTDEATPTVEPLKWFLRGITAHLLACRFSPSILRAHRGAIYDDSVTTKQLCQDAREKSGCLIR
jgi:hypothetical protein